MVDIDSDKLKVKLSDYVTHDFQNLQEPEASTNCKIIQDVPAITMDTKQTIRINSIQQNFREHNPMVEVDTDKLNLSDYVTHDFLKFQEPQSSTNYKIIQIEPSKTIDTHQKDNALVVVQVDIHLPSCSSNRGIDSTKEIGSNVKIQKKEKNMNGKTINESHILLVNNYEPGTDEISLFTEESQDELNFETGKLENETTETGETQQKKICHSNQLNQKTQNWMKTDEIEIYSQSRKSTKSEPSKDTYNNQSKVVKGIPTIQDADEVERLEEEVITSTVDGISKALTIKHLNIVSAKDREPVITNITEGIKSNKIDNKNNIVKENLQVSR
jgi:hypothetical protein